MIEQYFTKYDDSISGESFRDPMGMQVIWSALGQRIFGWHITSRANNLRNFTQALFHHYVVRAIERDETIEIPKSARGYYGSKDDPRFKKGLIIFLENLFIYTAVLSKFDCSGILGSQSAGNKLLQFGEEPVIFIHEDAGILVRQISLGLNGSYKTPLMQRNILDNDYRYSDGDIWVKIEHVFSGWDEALALKQTLLDIIKQVFDTFSSQGDRLDAESIQPYRELTMEAAVSAIWFGYSEIDASKKDRLISLYRSVLEKGDASSKQFGGFWREQLGLNAGAAGAIFDSLIDKSSESDNKALFEIAAHHVQDMVEKEKIKDILAVEPLLAFMVSLFDFVCCRENRHLDDIADKLEALPDTRENLQRHWNGIQWERARQSIKRVGAFSQTAAMRLEKLVNNQSAWDLTSCVRYVVACHRDIMEERGLYPWVILDGSGNLRHTGKGMPSGSWRFKDWVHDYYLGAVKNIHYGLKGKPNETL